MGDALRDSIRGIAVCAGTIVVSSSPRRSLSLAEARRALAAAWSDFEKEVGREGVDAPRLDESRKVIIGPELEWTRKLGDRGEQALSWWFEVFVGTEFRLPAVTFTVAMPQGGGRAFEAWGNRRGGDWGALRAEVEEHAATVSSWLSRVVEMGDPAGEKFAIVLDTAAVESPVLAASIGAVANDRLDSIGDLREAVARDEVARRALQVAWGGDPLDESKALVEGEAAVAQWRVESGDDFSALFCGHVLEHAAAYRGLVSHSAGTSARLVSLLKDDDDGSRGFGGTSSPSRSGLALANRALTAQLCRDALGEA